MQLITEKNISKVIIYVFIIIMTIMILSISYFNVKYSYTEFDKSMNAFVKEYYEKEKNIIRKEVSVIIDIIKYNSTKQEEEKDIKDDMVRLINNIGFQEIKSNYIFVYEVEDIDGGENFAKMLVNPNRLDLVGTYVSSSYKDSEGKKFREKFLSDIRQKGYSYTQYAYKKPNSNKIRQKLSYFEYYPKWNWIVAAGVYIDDIEAVIAQKRVKMQNNLNRQIYQTIFVYLLFLAIAIMLSFLVSNKIDEFFESYKKKVKRKSDDLKLLNQDLENRVKEELVKNREKEQILIQKSKLIALGEMISNIAHQWRQPLSELSSLFMLINFRYSLNKLDDSFMQEKTKEVEEVIEYMSRTIDDFRDFFIPKKEKQNFYLHEALDSVFVIIGSTLKNKRVELDVRVDRSIKTYNFLNEYKQVILNILSNSRDALVSKDIGNPKISIVARVDGKKITLSIEDNGGGIDVEPISKIFEPYFTTKSDSDGTGIGLYMSKMIIEKNMGGELSVVNTKEGARFDVVIPL